MAGIELLTIFNYVFFVFSCSIFGSYAFIALLSISELRGYFRKNSNVNYKTMLSFHHLPSISVLAPAYNEEKNIIENIKCLLTLQYQNFEIIIINDGSKDRTLETVIEYFDLVKVNRAFDIVVPCEPIRAIYQSRNSAYNNLYIVDKVNGGKADALNAGINVSQNDLYLAMDVDCIIEPDALLRMVKPFLEDDKREVIASGGVIRIANSCEVVDGRIASVNFPKNFWAKFQVLEYFRAFCLGRMAWSKLNGLLIISGAFGLFDRQRVLKVGGYDKTTVGEDLELVVRMRKYMHDVEKKKYRVAFIPDPLCWTEVPESLDVLSRQRNRWTRGGIDTIMKHKNMFLNPKYGLIGMVSFPYWVIFEWFAPVFELIGIIFVILMACLGLLNVNSFLLLLFFVFTFAVTFSVFAIFYEAYTFNKYMGQNYILQALFFSVIEMFVFQPLNLFFSIRGNYDYFFKKKKSWGVMTRKGFTKIS